MCIHFSGILLSTSLFLYLCTRNRFITHLFFGIIMKKVMLLAVTMIASLFAAAQTPKTGTLMVRPMFGLSASSFNSEYTAAGVNIDSKFRYGCTIGAEAGYQLNRLFQPSVGLFYAQQGNKFESTSWSEPVYLEMNYLAMPILANFYVTDGIALKVGVQPGLLLNGKSGSNDYAKDFQLQIPFGISYEYSHFVFDARMVVGVTKCFDKEYRTIYADDAVNEGFTLTVGYNFEL